MDNMGDQKRLMDLRCDMCSDIFSSLDAEFQFLRELAHKDFTELDYSHFINSVLRKIKENIRFSGANILLLKGDDSLIAFNLEEELYDDKHRYQKIKSYLDKEYSYDQNQWIFQSAIHLKEIYYPNIEEKTLNSFREETKNLLKILGYKGCYFLPLNIGKKKLGTIFFYNLDSPLYLNTQEKEQIRNYVKIIARSIDSIKIYEELKNQNQLIEEQNKNLIELLAKEKETNLILKKTLEKEEKLLEMKNHFISMASHEFRTPLSIIIFSADILNRYSEDLNVKDKDKYLKKIKSQSHRMTTLLDNLLLLSRIQSEKSNFQFSNFSPTAELKNMFQNNEIANTKKIPLEINYSFRGKIKANLSLFKNLMKNIIGNAIKYSVDKKEIEINVFREKKTCIIDVNDQGIGIPEHKMKKLFEPFTRGDNTGETQGSGLGLSIIKTIADYHFWDIQVDSKENIGTKVRVSIPLTKRSVKEIKKEQTV